MALFDMANIETLFHVLPKLLKPNGTFVFSIMHPAFNNSSAVHVAEEMDDNGEIKTVYSIKVSRYIIPTTNVDLLYAISPNRSFILSALFSIISTSASKMDSSLTALKSEPSLLKFHSSFR